MSHKVEQHIDKRLFQAALDLLSGRATAAKHFMYVDGEKLMPAVDKVTQHKIKVKELLESEPCKTARR